MANFDTLPIDIVRYHILDYIRNPKTFVDLGAVNENVRKN